MEEVRPSPGVHEHAHCPQCAATSQAARTRLWLVGGLAALLFVVAIYFGLQSTGGAIAGLGGAFLLGSLLCPLVMGAMMFFMMRKG